MRRESWVTVPNALSLSRLVLAAAFPVVSGPGRRLALVALASASDWLDGWLARRGGIASRGGAILDPITDRAFVLAAVSTFLFEGALTSGLADPRLYAGAILLASENAFRVAGEAVQALGGAGYTKDWPVERFLRDAKLLDIGAGTNEIRRMLIGRELIGAA